GWPSRLKSVNLCLVVGRASAPAGASAGGAAVVFLRVVGALATLLEGVLEAAFFVPVPVDAFAMRFTFRGCRGRAAETGNDNLACNSGRMGSEKLRSFVECSGRDASSIGWLSDWGNNANFAGASLGRLDRL